jgi:hypothetical protein
MNQFSLLSQAGSAAVSANSASEIDPGFDAVEAYFECITTCSLDDAECITVCTTQLRDHS